jgi:hypothetical protein
VGAPFRQGDVVGPGPGLDSETDEFAFFARRPAEVKVGAAYAETTLSR